MSFYVNIWIYMGLLWGQEKEIVLLYSPDWPLTRACVCVCGRTGTEEQLRRGCVSAVLPIPC